MKVVRPRGEQTACSGPVNVELLLLGVAGNELTFRVRSVRLAADGCPDPVARALAGFDGATPSGALIHSTSWRAQHHGVVLTYAALPDPSPAGARLLSPVAGIVGSTDLLAPSPAVIGHANVAAHACRHLAFLRQTDPAVAAAAAELPAIWSHIDSFLTLVTTHADSAVVSVPS